MIPIAAIRSIPRRFPPPWSVEESSESYRMVDASGQPLAYVYFEDEEGRRKVMNRLTRDEARRIAANIAKLPELLGASRQAMRDVRFSSDCGHDHASQRSAALCHKRL